MNFGKTILDLRRAKNATQEELAAALGVTAAAVSKWENNYTLPDILMLCALADYFEVSTDELLGRCKNPKYTIIAAENEALGQKVAQIAREFGLISRAIYINYKDAMEAAKKDDTVSCVTACFFTGFYECEAHLSTLVAVAPTEEQVLTTIRLVFEKYLPD